MQRHISAGTYDVPVAGAALRASPQHQAKTNLRSHPLAGPDLAPVGPVPIPAMEPFLSASQYHCVPIPLHEQNCSSSARARVYIYTYIYVCVCVLLWPCTLRVWAVTMRQLYTFYYQAPAPLQKPTMKPANRISHTMLNIGNTEK